MYLGILLLWLGIGLAYQHALLLLATFGLVLPVFLLYIRSEDRMMAAAFGEAYEEYRQRVGSLLPAIAPRRA
jgi:protein-S-isoprenylcysteine O-methyltransferase Ste14